MSSSRAKGLNVYLFHLKVKHNVLRWAFKLNNPQAMTGPYADSERAYKLLKPGYFFQ